MPIDVGSQERKVSSKLAHEVSVFSSEHKAQVEYQTTSETPSFESLARAFVTLAENRLSETQKMVLCMSAQTLRFHELTVTALADLVSRRSSVPYSTVKWNLRSLVKMGLLVGGDENNRGRKASLTEPAKMLVEYLERTK